MEKFEKFSGIAAPMPLVNIDTDMIIPKQFLKTIKRSGLGVNAFAEMRYKADGSEVEDFVLNKSAYREASILIAGDNFGCGSSREHAPWALSDFGIKVVVSTSFADIFFNNCFKNGILPINLEKTVIQDLFTKVDQNPGFKIKVDLKNQLIKLSTGDRIQFEIDNYKKSCLINGLDEIGQTLEKKDQIISFEEKYKNINPWLFEEMKI